MKRVLKQLLRHPRLTSYLREVYQDGKAEGLGGHMPETSVPEASPIACRCSAFTSPRLNLLVPSLAIQHLFGGIATALSLFDALAAQAGLDNLRLVVTDQHKFRHEDNRFSGWEIRAMEAEDGPGRSIVTVGDRYGKTLAVGPHDRFMATAWWTAVSARAIQDWQAAAYQLPAAVPWLYLIQDYEPGFYPWSSRYALAEATYHQPERLIAVFNSSILKGFFFAEGYSFPEAHCFEPVLHPILQHEQLRLQGTPKEKRVLVYGRPSVERNAFPVITMALRLFVERNPRTEWEFVSIGEPHPPVELGHGRQLCSLGKLSLQQYADQMARSALGISLMVSPHPSYPPLEMAAFGMRVISNRYKSKNLTLLTPRIISLDAVDPEDLAATLQKETVRELEAGLAQENAPAWHSYLVGRSDFAGLCTPLLQALFPK
jgi:hypothetical protein